MEEQLFNWLKDIAMTSPGLAAIGGLIYLYYKKRPKQIDTSKFVEKEYCHEHIDGLKEGIEKRFDKMDSSISEMRQMLFEFVSGSRK
jgi:hypothetical protein